MATILTKSVLERNPALESQEDTLRSIERSGLPRCLCEFLDFYRTLHPNSSIDWSPRGNHLFLDKIAPRGNLPRSLGYTVPLRAVERREQMTPYGDSYTAEELGPFHSNESVFLHFQGKANSLTLQLADVKRAATAFGLTTRPNDGEDSGTYVKITSLPGYYIKVVDPANTVRLFRGTRGDDPHIAELKRIGVKSTLAWKQPEVFESEIAEVLTKGSPASRVAFLHHHSYLRKVARNSAMVGVTPSFERARSWGDNVLILDVPREIIISGVKAGPYDEEAELFIPFEIADSWITNITSGKVRPFTPSESPLY